MEIFFQVELISKIQGKENEKLNYTSVYAFSFIFFHISMASYIQKFIS